MIKKIIIAIDGPSSSGKSTLASQLAKMLNYIHVDTGAMYRRLSLFFLERGLLKEGTLDKRMLIASLKDINIKFQISGNLDLDKIDFNAKEAEKKLHSMEITEIVSSVAELPEVREKLMYLQRSSGRERGIVMDGRDIGTVIFPKAELKIFLNAPLSVRAKRRYEEIYQKNPNISYSKVLNSIFIRDKRDTNRKIAPLKKAQEAIEIDNGLLSMQEQLSFICNLAKKIIEN